MKELKKILSAIFGKEIDFLDVSLNKEIPMPDNLCEGNYYDDIDSMSEDLEHHSLLCACPPFSCKMDVDEIKESDKRWVYGIPPCMNSNFAYLQHVFYYSYCNGKVAVVLPTGTLTSQQKKEAAIRKNMIEAGVIDGVISLPGNLLEEISIPVSIWILHKKRTHKDILLVDASQMGTLARRSERIFSEASLKILANIYQDWEKDKEVSLPIFARICNIEQIRGKKYSLNPGDYYI